MGRIKMRRLNLALSALVVLWISQSAFASTTIVIKSSSSCVDVPGDSSSSGVGLQQYKCNGTGAQAFTFVQNSDGTFKIVPNSNTSLCLSGSPASAGTRITQVACSTTLATQKFKLVANGSNYNITTSTGSFCLDITGASIANGAALELWTCNGGSNQLFSLTNPVPTPTPTPKPATPTPTPTAGSSTGVTAVAANTFLNSLGINTHIAQGYSETSIVSPLQYLGIRQIRDGASNISSIISACASAGLHATINAGGDLVDLLADGRTLASSGVLLALEGPNEPNNFPITYNGVTGGGSGSWVAVADFQRDLYAQSKADSTLKNYPVFGVSEEGGEVNNVGLQFLTIPTGAGALLPDGTQFADYVNIHNYVSSTQSTLYTDNQAWNAASPTLNSSWDGLYTEVGVPWYGRFLGYSTAQLPNVARVTTETGWDSVSNPGGTSVQGKVLLNTYFAQYKEGWSYTFIYELVDGQGSSGSQGVFTSAFAAKPAATYIHNTTTILADTKSFTPGKLPYTIANEPSTVHDLLLQKSSGAFELAVWGESVSASNSVTVSLGGNHQTINVYDPTIGTTSTVTYSNVSSVPLTLTDHLLIVEIIN